MREKKIFLLVFSIFFIVRGFEHNCQDIKRKFTTHIYDPEVHPDLLRRNSVVSSMQNATQNFQINILLDRGYRQYPDAGYTFQTAAQIWNEILGETPSSSPIWITTDFKRLPPGVLGQSDTTNIFFSCESREVNNIFDVLSERLQVQFPDCSKGVDFILPDQTRFANGVDLNKAHMKALGFSGLDQYFGRYDGYINFNTRFTRSIDFDLSDGIDPGKTCFLSMVLHEIGHFAGFRSGVDRVDYGMQDFYPTILDFYRFISWEKVDFMSTARVVESVMNPDHYFYNPKLPDFGRSYYKFSTGSYLGDGHQASHWKDDRINEYGLLGIMDPSLGRNKYEHITDLDLQAMRLSGYSVDISQKPIIFHYYQIQITNSLKKIAFMPDFIFSESIKCHMGRDKENLEVVQAQYDKPTGEYFCTFPASETRCYLMIETDTTKRSSDLLKLSSFRACDDF